MTTSHWEKLGHYSKSLVPDDKLLDKLKIDSDKGLAPISAEIDGYGIKNIESKKALYRKSDGQILRIVSSTYGTRKNISRSFSRINEFNKKLDLGNSNIHFGEFEQYGKIWAVVKLDDIGFSLKDVDDIAYYLLFTISATNPNLVEIRIIALRLVCTNGMTSTEINILLGEVEITQDLIKKVKKKIEFERNYYELSANALLEHNYKKRDVYLYLADLFGYSDDKHKILNDQGQRVLENIEYQPGYRYGSRTWWNVFNAVTYEIDHYHDYDKNSIYSAWFGKYRNFKSEALIKALTFLNVDIKIKDE